MPRPSTWPTSAGRPARSSRLTGAPGAGTLARAGGKPEQTAENPVATAGSLVAIAGSLVAIAGSPVATAGSLVVIEACLVAAGGSPVVTESKVIGKLVKAVRSLQATLRENKNMLAT